MSRFFNWRIFSSLTSSQKYHRGRFVYLTDAWYDFRECISKRHNLYDILYIFFHIYNTEYLFSSTVFLRNSLNNDFVFWFSGAMIVQIISVTVIYQWVISMTQMTSDEEVEWNAWFVNTDLTLNLTYCKWHRMTSYIIGWQFFRVHLYIISSGFRLGLTFGISFSRWFRFWFASFLDDKECNST